MSNKSTEIQTLESAFNAISNELKERLNISSINVGVYRYAQKDGTFWFQDQHQNGFDAHRDTENYIYVRYNGKQKTDRVNKKTPFRLVIRLANCQNIEQITEYIFYLLKEAIQKFSATIEDDATFETNKQEVFRVEVNKDIVKQKSEIASAYIDFTLCTTILRNCKIEDLTCVKC
jgi:hypothetical protein